MKLALTPEQRIKWFGSRKGEELEARLQKIISENEESPVIAELVGMIETAMIVAWDKIGDAESRLDQIANFIESDEFHDFLDTVGIEVTEPDCD